MIRRFLATLILCVSASPEAQAAAFWIQHMARPPLTPTELRRAFWRD